MLKTFAGKEGRTSILPPHPVGSPFIALDFTMQCNDKSHFTDNALMHYLFCEVFWLRFRVELYCFVFST